MPDGRILDGEFLNETRKDRTIYEFLEYTLIDGNYYYNDVQNGTQELVMAANGCSHVWVTKSTAGVLCFNDGCAVRTPQLRQFFANNGMGYIVDKCIVCSGVAMLSYYASIKTSYQVSVASEFLIASDWNLRNLSRSVGDGGPITLLVADDLAWQNRFDLEDTVLLAAPHFKAHLWDLLLHNILPGSYSAQDFKDLYNNVHGQKAYNLTSLSGQSILIDYDTQRDMVMVAGGDLYFADIKGIDGYVHDA